MTWFRKAFPNMLTLLRVILSCVLNIYLLKRFGSTIIPIILFGIIIVSDFVDGKIARLYGCISQFGSIFDILADLFFILTTYSVLYYFGILPLWFLFIILFKFFEFILTSFLFKKYISMGAIFFFDFLGRLSAGLFYIIPIFSYVLYQTSIKLYFAVVVQLIYCSTFIAIISTSYRIWRLCRENKMRSITR